MSKKDKKTKNKKDQYIKDQHSPHLFDVGDHINKMLNIISLISNKQNNNFQSGPFKLLKRMITPDIIDSLPYHNVKTPTEDKELGKIHHKIIILSDGGSCDSINNEDVNIIGNISSMLQDRLSEIRNLHNVRTAQKQVASIDDVIINSQKLSNGFLNALNCKEQSEDGEPNIHFITSILRNCNPSHHYRTASLETMNVLSGIIDDVSSYTNTQDFWQSIASRIKLAYHDTIENSEIMSKFAATTIRIPFEDVEGSIEGHNICPKFKTINNANKQVPVPYAYCRDYCAEGRPESDGTVTCKYNEFLKTIDTHEKVFNRYPQIKNPDNEHSKLKLEDGKRFHPRKDNAYSIEQRMQKSQINNSTHSVVANIESNLREKSTDDSKESLQSLGKRLVLLSDKQQIPEQNTEYQINNKKDKKDKSFYENNTERNLRKIPYNKEDIDTLLDEMLEREYPREDSKRKNK